jgi:hypothetical protein
LSERLHASFTRSFAPLQGSEQPQQLQPLNAADMSPPSTVQRLLYWLMLNTAVRDKLEAVLGGRISHSTEALMQDEPAGDSHRRELSAMNALQRCGLTPDRRVWCPSWNEMAATRQLEVHDSAGHILCSIYVNGQVSTEESIQAELRQHQVHNMTVYWDADQGVWQVEPTANKRPRRDKGPGLTKEEVDGQEQQEVEEVQDQEGAVLQVGGLVDPVTMAQEEQPKMCSNTMGCVQTCARQHPHMYHSNS